MALLSRYSYRTVVIASLISAIVNGALALSKIGIGYFGHSHALLADGVHSLSDLIIDALVLFAAHLGSQQPDKEHPYGHRRIETLASIVLAMLLVVVGLGIAYDALQHLLHPVHADMPSVWVIVFAVISVMANEALFRYMLAQSNKIYSDLLRTNAWHNRSDALVSLLVVFSAAGTRFGFRYLDTIGALVIGALILFMAIKMIANSTKELIDTGVDKETLKNITKAILSIPSVDTIHQLRTRSHGGHVFVDVHIQVSPEISVSEGHYISEKVHLFLKQKFKSILDVTVHIDPENDATSMPSIHLPNRPMINYLLKQQGDSLPGFLEISRYILHYLNGHLTLELYMPLEILKQHKASDLHSLYSAALKSEEGVAQIRIYFE